MVSTFKVAFWDFKLKKKKIRFLCFVCCYIEMSLSNDSVIASNWKEFTRPDGREQPANEFDFFFAGVYNSKYTE